MPGATTRRSYPFGQLTDNITDLLSVPDLAQSIDDDLFSAATGILTAHACLAYRTSGDGDLSVAQNGVAISFPHEVFDTDGYHDNSTNNSRITVPTGLAGYYLVGASIRWAADTHGTVRGLLIDVNGDGNPIVENRESTPADTFGTGATPSLSVATLCLLSNGDYIRAVATQDSGSTLAVKQIGNTPNLWAVRLPFGA